MAEKEEDYFQRVKPDIYKFAAHIAVRLLDRKIDIEAHNTENILEESAVYIANHVRFEDSLVLPATVFDQKHQIIRMAAKVEYFEGKGLDDNGKLGRSVKFFMKHTQMLPVDRENRDPRGFQKLQAAANYHFNKQESVGFHADGTRVDDGKLYKFKSGAARIAIAAAVPMIPVGFVYSEYSNGQKLHVDVMFGKPIRPEEYITPVRTILPGRVKLAEHFTQVAEDRVSEMTGMKQTGVFAELRKHRPKAEPQE